MLELVRSTVAETLRSLFDRIANPEAVDVFVGFFNQIDGRRFMMSVNAGEYNERGNHRKVLQGAVVTISIYAGEGKIEVIQAFLPVVWQNESRDRAWYADCIVVGGDDVVRVVNADIVD